MFLRFAVLTVPLFLATGYTGGQGAARAEDADRRMGFVSIPPGEFVRGLDTGAYREKPAHRVRISRSFELGKYEVTQAQWESVMGQNPSHFRAAHELEFANIPAGRFAMGREDGDGREYPVREVRITRPFELGTQAQWRFVRGARS